MVRFADEVSKTSSESSPELQVERHPSQLSEVETATNEKTSKVRSKSGDSSNGEDLHLISTIKSAAGKAKKKLHLSSIHASAPSKLFNPTNVRVHLKWDDDDQPSREAHLLWRSRDNRKGRNSMAVPASALKKEFSFSERMKSIKSKLHDVGKNIWLMVISFPYWDMAFWSGWSYTWGSVLFVIDGAWSWGPTAFPSTEWPGEEKYAVGLAFFFGALFYQLGATMAYLEAVNDGSFQGSAMRRLLEGNEQEQKKMIDEKIHSFFGHMVPHPHKKNDLEKAEAAADAVDPEAGWKARERHERPGSIYPPDKAPAPRRGGIDYGEAEEGESSEYMTWRWYPSWHRLRTHHVYEIGYLACAIQLFGATLYGMTGVVALPGIIDTLEEWQENACYWIPQIVASCCFLTASLLFTLETQEKWYKPEFTVIGWWIGAWATVGSVGFLLCGSLGPASFTQDWAVYQSLLSSMWGSAGYLISSLLQWYEAINKRPVAELFNDPGEMKSWQVHPI